MTRIRIDVDLALRYLGAGQARGPAWADVERTARELEDSGVHSLDLVTGTMFIPSIAPADSAYFSWYAV